MWDEGSEPGLLSEAINRHLAFGRDAPPVTLSEGSLTLTCIRCRHRMPAREAIVTRTRTEVLYECRRDAAPLVRIHARDYSFEDGELTISVGGETSDWWDFVDRAR